MPKFDSAIYNASKNNNQFGTIFFYFISLGLVTIAITKGVTPVRHGHIPPVLEPPKSPSLIIREKVIEFSQVALKKSPVFFRNVSLLVIVLDHFVKSYLSGLLYT